MSDTLCELLYKMRDAVNADHLAYALYLSTEVHNKLRHLIASKEQKDCSLNCEIPRSTNDKLKEN